MSKIYNKNCKICGKPFVSTSHLARLCGDECRKISQREVAAIAQNKVRKDREKLRLNHNSIVDINTKARQLGLSYGQYIARMDKLNGKY